MAHGFAATRHDGLAPYAERFAEAGLAVLLFDYRHFGDSEGEPRQLLDITLQHEDYRAAIAYARSRSEVDPARIALFGSSFSGGHVVHLAARDPSIAAVVSQAPFMDGLVQVRRIPLGPLTKATGLGVRDEIAALRRRPPVTMPALGRPGEAAAMTSPSSYDGYLSIVGEESKWRNDITARLMLRVAPYRPVKDAQRVSCPLLVCAADHDDLTPPEPAVLCAERAPRGELRRYDADHWSVYKGRTFEAVVADQVEFLARHLGEGTG